MRRLRAERTATLRQFAQVRLDLIQREGVVGELDAAERRALDLLKSAREALDKLTARQAEAQTQHMQTEAERHARADEVTKLLGTLEELQARVEPQVRSSTDWIGQKAIVDRAEAVWNAADQKAKQAEADRAAKGKPYEADPLFLYLWKRNYGTAQYRANLLVSYLDGKVASLVGFQDARANYAMLNEIPARLREHAERCKADKEAQSEKLVAIEREGLKQAGSEPVEAQLVAARSTLADADQRLTDADAATKELDQERAKLLTESQSSIYQQAVDILAQADAAEGLQSLRRSAAQTRSDADDAILTQIEAIDARIEEAERQAADLRTQAAELARRRADLEAQRDEFRRRGYDNPMGQFTNEQAIGNVLGDILKGVVQGAVLGQVLNGGYGQRAPRADGGFGGNGGFTFPGSGGGQAPPGPWIQPGQSGGGWGPSSGSSSGGGSGGDDSFRTGGTF